MFGCAMALSGCLALPSADQERQRCVKAYEADTQRQCANAIAITAAEAAKIEGALFIDYRTTEAIAVSTLPNAIAIATFQADPEKFRGRPIVFYDYSGTMSCSVAEGLRQEGFKAFALAGGVLGWAWSGEKFVKNGATVHSVHVYKKKWALLPAGYKAIYSWWMPWWVNSQRTGCY